jgi:hypothetical protein
VRRLDLKSAALITTSKLIGCSRNVVKELKKGLKEARDLRFQLFLSCEDEIS